MGTVNREQHWSDADDRLRAQIEAQRDRDIAEWHAAMGSTRRQALAQWWRNNPWHAARVIAATVAVALAVALLVTA